MKQYNFYVKSVFFNDGSVTMSQPKANDVNTYRCNTYSKDKDTYIDYFNNIEEANTFYSEGVKGLRKADK